ncbi:MAG: exodeoxyribonuclease VII large subunit, partial [Fusobacteriaceae bacterium]
ELEKLFQKLVEAEESLKRVIQNFLLQQETNMKIRIEKLIGLNPIRILSSGYSLTEKNGNIIKNTKNLNIGDEIITKLKNGRIKSTIKELEEEHE